MTPRVKTEPGFTQGGLRLVLCVVLAGCASIVVALPMPVPPGERPSLVVLRRTDDALLARDRRRAAMAPDDDTARALDAVVLDAGRLETRTSNRPELSLETLADRARRGREAVARRHGPSALAAMRAKAVMRLVAVFDPRATRDTGSTAAVVGGFRVASTRWGVVRDGRLIAPPLVLRTLYAARWNAIVGVSPTTGFGRAELRAYHGWLALHAEDVGRELRMNATTALLEAGGGAAAEEAFAMLLLEDGSDVSAETAYERLYDRDHALRFRNHALFAHVRAR